MQTSAIMFLQAVIYFITGDAFEQGAKSISSWYHFLTSVSSPHSMKCFKRHNDAHYTTLMKKKRKKNKTTKHG